MGVSGNLFYLSKNFIKGRRNLPREAIGPKGSNCSSRAVPSKISTETYIHLGFYSVFRGRTPCSLSLDPPMYDVRPMRKCTYRSIFVKIVAQQSSNVRGLQLLL